MISNINIFKLPNRITRHFGKQNGVPNEEATSSSARIGKGEVGAVDQSQMSITEDTLNFKPYVQGLSSFIKNCRTPMTIAVQGDWGSGKTSFMHMIDDSISDSCECIWINTWQYSQFKLDDSLQLMFLAKIIKMLSGHIKKRDTEKIFLALRVLSEITRTFTGLNFYGLMKVKSDNDKSKDIINSLEDIKVEFSKIVKQRISYLNSVDVKTKGSPKEDKNRIVFFVDDLDRLHPAKAVEILEILKVFLDCEYCVFVLAIDYDVVVNGIKLKYENTLNESKSKEFFDKLIQLPFKMPVDKYDIHKFTKSQFTRIGVNIEEEKLNGFIEVISKSTTFNPRTIKRYFNIFEMDYNIIKSQKNSLMNKEENFALYLAYSLCIQMYFQDVYVYLSKQKMRTEFEKLHKVISYYNGNAWGEDIVELTKWMRRFTVNINEDYVRKVGEFFSKLFDVLNFYREGLEEIDISILLRIFQIQSTVVLDQEILSHDQITNIDDEARVSTNEILSSIENEDLEGGDGYIYINLAEERAGKKSTWTKSKVSEIRYNDGIMSFSESVNDYAQALAVFLKYFYRDNPEKFESMVNQYKLSELSVLFTGSSGNGGFISRRMIDGSDIPFETKTHSYYKVFNMKRILEILEKKPEKLEFLVKPHMK
ncbi:KAP family P-loop NTPase fold protein [Proteiniclasticum ruminis]|uniref:KAP family P-loop domain-containing protein n=1 Tax=Proteiniclasticum ruminis TaxID=398199 RepID=A0A1G8LQI5_9CLOT|nr:P-loop NTPase fold protein [Proteiniclasticum ruminis]SDI57747.1 KAP family P-loop domain-containing protein [Proteiniclasticum ruminis]